MTCQYFGATLASPHRNDKRIYFKRRCYYCYCAWGFPSLLGFRSLNVSESGPASVSPVSRIHGALKVDSGDVQIVEVKSRCYKRVCVCIWMYSTVKIIYLGKRCGCCLLSFSDILYWHISQPYRTWVRHADWLTGCTVGRWDQFAFAFALGTFLADLGRVRQSEVQRFALLYQVPRI